MQSSNKRKDISPLQVVNQKTKKVRRRKERTVWETSMEVETPRTAIGSTLADDANEEG